MEMKSNYVAILCMLLMQSTSVGQQNDRSTPTDCRLITTKDLSDSKAPTFEAYPVPIRQGVTRPKLDLSSNPLATTYRTVLRREVAKGPNFSGHYRVAIWGCGSSCAMFAVVNLKTGRVITPRGFTTVSGVHLMANEFLPNAETDFWGFRFRSDSTLLVVVGALNEDESKEGAFYFSMKNERLVPIHTTVVKKNCDSTHP